ncbi:MAG: ATP-binding protein [Chloroflexota bacterium]
MFYSFRFSLLMAMLAVAGVAIITVTIFVGWTTRAQFSQYVEAGREIRQERLEQALVLWGDSATSNQLDNSVFGSIQFLRDDIQLDQGNFRLETVGTIGYLQEFNDVDDPILRDGERLRLELAPDGELLVYEGQDVVGTLFVDPVSDYELALAEEAFFETVNWTLVITAVVAGIAAISLTVILSRRILHPVAALTLAARRMENGDLEQRVKVNATGEIGELAQAFNAMAEALNRNEGLRRNMVTDIAHELRTPLTNIRGYLEAIQDGMLQPNPETVDMLHEEAVMLNRLIQDLQELALAEAGALYIETQDVSLDAVIEQVIVASQASANNKQINLTTELPDTMPSVLGDQRRIGQVLRNLINNAITHTPPEGDVRVTTDVYPNEIAVTVTNTGEGIAPEHLPYLFERFYRVDPSRNRATGGAGLGLAIVKNLVEAQGGRVNVNSEQGKGATFSFTIPRALERAPMPTL